MAIIMPILLSRAAEIAVSPDSPRVPVATALEVRDERAGRGSS
jgi:hypothetical protein